MNVLIENVTVSGVASAIPRNSFDLNTLMTEFGVNEVNRIIESTGIKRIRVASNGMKASDLCYAAAINLLSTNRIDPASIDAIVFVSQTPDVIMPATSAILQHKLGLSTQVIALDINYGCSGYVYGLYVSSLLIASGGCKKVLLCAGDVITPLINSNDRNVRMVFGDAGSATIIERGSDSIGFSIKTDGSGSEFLRAKSDEYGKSYIHMNGSAVMEFALRDVPFVIDEVLKVKEWKSNEVGVFALHQANYFMLNYLRKKMKLEQSAVPISVENTGNTGPASIPLLLSLQHKLLRSSDRLFKTVMCGFGVGLSCAAVGLNLTNTSILDPIEI